MSQTPMSFLQKIPEYLSAWFAMLMGKPRSSFKSQQTTQTEQVKPTMPDPEDPVARDIAAAKEASKKVFSAVEEKIKPIVDKEKSDASGKFTNIIAMSKNMLTPATIKKIGIGLAVLVLVILAVSILPGMITKVRNGQVSVDINTTSTPTPAEFRPTQPSMYANDKTILELEESLNILDKQINSTNIRETTLTPPELDFTVSF